MNDNDFSVNSGPKVAIKYLQKALNSKIRNVDIDGYIGEQTNKAINSVDEKWLIKEIQKAREALTNGDKVMTAGGIYGKVKEVSEKYFIIEIADNTRIRVAKDSVYPAADETPTQA